MMSKNTKEFGRFGRVILTYGRSLMSLVAAQSLARRGINVIGCDSVDLTALRFSKYCSDYFLHPDPEMDEDAYVRGMAEMIERFAPQSDAPYILMPMFDNARILSRRVHELPSRVTLAAPRWDSINAVYPKDRLVETLTDYHGVAPVSAVVLDEPSLEQAMRAISFPMVIKPAEGVGGRGVMFVDDEGDLRAAYLELRGDFNGPLVLQEAAPGEDYCMTAIAKDGELRATMAYKNLDTFPKKSGAGTLRETVDHEPFVKATKSILSATEWNGVAEIDFRWDGNPETPPKLIEVNARFWAGLYHSMASGVDYPWLLYQLAAYGDIAEIAKAEIGVRTQTPVLSGLSTVTAITSRAMRFRPARRVVRSGWRKIKEGKIKAGFGTIWRGVIGAISLNRAAFAAMEKLDQTEHATSEFDHESDPYAGLGFLFILSSLVRYGRLPDEVKY